MDGFDLWTAMGKFEPKTRGAIMSKNTYWCQSTAANLPGVMEGDSWPPLKPECMKLMPSPIGSSRWAANHLRDNQFLDRAATANGWIS